MPSELYKPKNDGYIVLNLGEPELKKQTIGADYIEYPITGCDSEGDIAVARRYSLFDEFRTALRARFPGLYIPPLPSKKITGNTEDLTKLERKHFLGLFL